MRHVAAVVVDGAEGVATPASWSTTSSPFLSNDVDVGVDAQAAGSFTAAFPGSSTTDPFTTVSTGFTAQIVVESTTVDSTAAAESTDEVVLPLEEQIASFVSLPSSLVLPTPEDDDDPATWVSTGVGEGNSPAAVANDLNSLHSKLYPPPRSLLLLALLLLLLAVAVCLSGRAAGDAAVSGVNSIALGSIRTSDGTKREIPSSSKIEPVNTCSVIEGFNIQCSASIHHGVGVVVGNRRRG